jgi:hypothetical protein
LKSREWLGDQAAVSCSRAGVPDLVYVRSETPNRWRCVYDGTEELRRVQAVV